MELVIRTLTPIAESDLPAREKLRRALRNHLRQAANDPSLSKIVDLWKSLRAERRDHIVAFRDQYGRPWPHNIDESISASGVANPEPKLAFPVPGSGWTLHPRGCSTPRP